MKNTTYTNSVSLTHIRKYIIKNLNDLFLLQVLNMVYNIHVNTHAKNYVTVNVMDVHLVITQ